MKQKSLDLNTELDYACVVLPAHQKWNRNSWSVNFFDIICNPEEEKTQYVLIPSKVKAHFYMTESWH
jgi:hypothetical protein